MPIRSLAFLASFDFVLAYFGGRFTDSVVLSGFVFCKILDSFFGFSPVWSGRRRSAGFKPVRCASERAALV
jgi:hypothetical protein